MPVRALRILHAANLRLDAALSISGPVPDDMRSLLEDATTTAFTRIVSAAIEQDADALLITGNTFDAGAGSLSADISLQQELRRLDEHGLPVLITPGLLDPASAWDDIPALPDNVTVFFQSQDAGVDLTDHDRHLATILPISSQIGAEAPELERILSKSGRQTTERGFLIGMWLPETSGKRSMTSAGYASLDYLAAGEAGGSVHLPLTEGYVHLQAGPQGLHSGESGLHGYQLVDVDSDGKIQSRLVPVAPVRWETCRIDGRGILNHDALCEQMLSQLEDLAGYAGEQLRIIQWPIDQSLLESVGIVTERELQLLQDSLAELSDQPKHGLCYLHRVVAVWNDELCPSTVDRELWQDYTMEMERWTPLELERLLKLWEQQTGSAAIPTGWPTDEQWPPVDLERVRRRALQNGRRWFRQTGGGV